MDALLIDEDEYVLRFTGPKLYRVYREDLNLLADLLKEYNRCQVLPEIPNIYEVSREEYPEDAPWPHPPGEYRMYIIDNWILAEHPAHFTLARKDKEWRPGADGLPRCHKEILQLFSINRLVPHSEHLTRDLEAWVREVLTITEKTDLCTWMNNRRYSIGDHYIPLYNEVEW